MAKDQKEEKPRFKDGKLTRYGMEMAIKEGGSVQTSDGRTLTKLEELPSEAELAKGDPELEASVAKDLQAQIKDLQAQLKSLPKQTEVVATGQQGTGTGEGANGTITQS